MYQRYKERFGTVGVVLGVIALILAVGGSAIAASGLNGKQKKEVKAIAKSFAGKPGAPGAPGTNGTNGTNGTPGTPGADGTDGKSVVVAAEAKGANCEEGGASFEAEGSGTKKYACNGSPWTAGGKLPSGQSENGTWAAGNIPSSGAAQWMPISFPIPLASNLTAAHAHYINKAGKELLFNGTTFEVEEVASHPDCPGSAISPTAVKGNLCLYTSDEEGMTGANPAEERGIFGGATISTFHNAEPGFGGTALGVSKVGSIVQVTAMAANANARGTWAVTGS